MAIRNEYMPFTTALKTTYTDREISQTLNKVYVPMASAPLNVPPIPVQSPLEKLDAEINAVCRLAR